VPGSGKVSALTINAIVYGTDFSVWSLNAGHYASFVAKHFSAELLVAHAFILTQAAMEVEIDQSLVSQQRKDLQFLLSRKAFALGQDSVAATPVLLEGDPKDAIPHLADKNAPSLIVLGTHGGGWVERSLIGSVAEAILKSTSWPCLTVSPRARSAISKALPFHRILYVTDFTPAAARAAAYAVSFAREVSADIDVLNVIENEVLDHPDRLDDLLKCFYGALKDIVPHHVKAFSNRETFVEAGKAHHQILQHIQERSIDLLVLGIQKTSHLGMELTASEAFRLIVSAECPVLTIAG
jgi:nucleotide-binding universal stress UspA family protein